MAKPPSLRWVAVCLLAGMFFLARVPRVHAQAIDQLRDEVRVSDPDPPRPKNSKPDDDRDDHHGNPWDDDCGDDLETELVTTIAGLGAIVATLPYWAPIGWAEDTYSRTGHFPQYPYQYDDGYMMLNPVEAHGAPGPRDPFLWALRARTEHGTDFADLSWIGVNLLLETSPRLGLETDVRFFQEEQFGVNAPQFDTAWLGDVNVFFRFAQAEWIQMRSGLGVNFLSDRQQTDVGLNFTYAGDLYLAKPWVLSGEFDCGLLGDETLFHARLTTGLQYRGLEAYIGYDMIDVGSFHTDSLVTGLRLWF